MWRRIAVVLFLGYAAIWTALLLVPDVTRIFFIPSDLPQEITSGLPMDKIVHASGYFVLTVLANAAFGQRPRGMHPIWLAGGVILHGTATEIAQYFIPLRSADILDWCWDVAGTIIGTRSTSHTQLAQCTPSR